MEWYLLIQTENGGNLDFAAFFNGDKATMVPRRIGEILLGDKRPKNISWFGITQDQAKELKLSDKSLSYFTKTMGQTLKLDVLKDKIASSNLNPRKNLCQ